MADPSVINLYGIPTLLSHGDAYCTDDKAYQAFRKQVRDPAWQQEFLSLPIESRHAKARTIREQSELAKSEKRPAIMDVNPIAIHDALKQARVTRMIHGHTHRPAQHTHDLEGAFAERWVLPDWYDSGGYLACDTRGCRLMDIR